MLDTKFLVDNAALIKTAYSYRSGSYDVDAALNLDTKRRDILKKVEALKANRNAVSDKIAVMKREKKNADALIAEMKACGDKIKELDAELAVIESDFRLAMLSLPNVPHASVPKGRDDKDNNEVRRHLEPTKFDFTPQPHWDIGTNLKILDFESAAKITGARFTVYRGFGARLERGIMAFMLDTHFKAGYTEILPPFMVNRDSMTGTGQLPKFEEDMFALKNTNYYLIPTAEVPVTNLFRDNTLNIAELPVKYCAYTPCFRAEAGSAGRDTRGLIRQHQFNKVELVKFADPEKSYDELESLTADAENILKLLKIPFRTVALCTGDLGFSSAKTYDIEVWMPSYGRYVEISSCSNFEDFQARRMNIKLTGGSGKFVHTLNGSGLAIGRTTAAILENYQNADGSVTVPEVLRPYVGTDVIK